ncbi:hypothetical protein FRC06_002829 [Ceratobasidium sp. 370]|nr:hypothetical protein FRC06_002829 [Ceratobasidium sp. 370]
MPADRDHDEEAPESEEPKLMVHSRQMTRLEDMYWDVDKILALVKKWQRMSAEQRENYEALSSDERKRQLVLVKVFIQLEPGMLAQICSGRQAESSTALAYTSKMLAKGQTNCRSEDAQKVRLALASWRKWDPAFGPEDKASRGLEHPGTAFELSTLDVDWNNIQQRTKFLEGDPPMDEFSLGRFCYPNGEGDKLRPWVNAFWGELLLKGAEAILFSPKTSKSSLDMDGGARGRCRTASKRRGPIGLAKKYAIKEITAPFIAYIVVMVRQALTSDEMFQEVCSGFDYTVFYDEVRRFLEEPKYATVSKNLLEWWNRELLSRYPADVAGSSQAEQCQHGMLAALDAALGPGGELASEADGGASGADGDAGE